MSCFWRHKWSKWSDIKQERWKRQISFGSNEMLSYIREYQERKCEDCGLHEKRYLDGE